MDNQDYNDYNHNNGFNFYRNNNQYNQNQNIPYNTVNQYYYNRNKYGTENISPSPSKERKRYGKLIIIVSVLIFVLSAFIFYKSFYSKSFKKERTFMIYMVGSDLETKSKQGTYSIADIVGENIDLENNNVVLMTGGAEKWHNFIEADEIGIYELTKEGFVRKKSLPLDSMGSSNTLESFLNYSYKNYSSEKYDMIFWNHGLGAIGIEQDEISKDFLTIKELNTAFENSFFKDNKLELTIFYNCLASNLHIASIMKDYSEYMVASEEIMYLSKVLNRLGFLEKVEQDNTGYDVGYLFIEQSDKVVNEYNDSHKKKIDSTLSIINLSKMDNLITKLNNFVKSININSKYYEISNMRRNMHTYGIAQTYDYDTVDLYTLVESLGTITNNKTEANSVLSALKETIEYTSNLNDYSKGLAVYFPYFGNDNAIETHLALFEKVFNDNYYSFINNFYQVRSGAKRTRRANSNNINKLSNEIVVNNNTISIELTEEEKNNYQGANVYVFNKYGDKYDLLLQSDNIELKGNKLVFNNNKILKVDESIISYINEELVYGKLTDNDEMLNVKYSIDNNKIEQTILDSNEYISSSLLDYSIYKEAYFTRLSYDLLEDNEINEDWKSTKSRIDIKVDKNKMNIEYTNNIEKDYYVLIEMYDIYNDVYYSSIKNVVNE